MKQAIFRSVVLVVVIAAIATPATADGGKQAVTALRELDQAYVEAWKQEGTGNQEASLLQLFAPDAVIMPGGGTDPKQGLDALRGFWFPEGAPPTNVLSFEHTVLGTEVSGDLGVVYGRSRLEFEYDGNRSGQEGNFLLAARRQDTGEWKITEMIWNNRPMP